MSGPHDPQIYTDADCITGALMNMKILDSYHRPTDSET
jgi:hypothetical protein